MWTNNSSLLKTKEKSDAFLPPFCAKPYCDWHKPEAVPADKAFQKFGVNKIQRWPYFNQKYRCNRCEGTFVQSFFSLNYRDRKPDNYEEIHDLLIVGASKKAIARKFKIDEDTVRRRKKKLSRWALLAWHKDQDKMKITESVAYDGLENFAYSQYDPNNINHAVGRESLYIYDFNLSPMNRKGKMSERQKVIKKQLELDHGKYDGRAIQVDSKRIFERLLSKTDGELHLHSDNHYAYRRAIASMPGKDRIVHAITPAKVTRNFRNRLFAINHTDMLTRHQTGNFKRETISFAKNTVAMAETFILFAVHKNYLRPRFYRKHKRDPKAHIESPAMALKLKTKILSFKEFYRSRISIHHVSLSSDWLDFFDSTDLRSRRCIRAYAGI